MDDDLARARARFEHDEVEAQRLQDRHSQLRDNVANPSWHARLVDNLQQSNLPQVPVYQTVSRQTNKRAMVGLKSRKYDYVRKHGRAPFTAWVLSYGKEYDAGVWTRYIFVSPDGPKAGTVFWKRNQSSWGSRRHGASYLDTGLPEAGGWVRSYKTSVAWEQGEPDTLPEDCQDGVVGILHALERGTLRAVDHGNLAAGVVVPESGW